MIRDLALKERDQVESCLWNLFQLVIDGFRVKETCTVTRNHRIQVVFQQLIVLKLQYLLQDRPIPVETHQDWLGHQDLTTSLIIFEENSNSFGYFGIIKRQKDADLKFLVNSVERKKLLDVHLLDTQNKVFPQQRSKMVCKWSSFDLESAYWEVFIIHQLFIL